MLFLLKMEDSCDINKLKKIGSFSITKKVFILNNNRLNDDNLSSIIGKLNFEIFIQFVKK